MKKISFFLINLFVLIFTSFSQDKLTSEEIYSKCSESIVFIYCYDYRNTLISTGSGVIINNEGLIYTDYHVIDKANTIQIRNGNEIYDSIPCVGFDPYIDAAVLKLPNGNYPFISISNNNTHNLGSTIYAFGNPQGYSKTLSEGLISSFRLNQYPPNIQISAPISPGSSGGALLNEQGELIGITCSTEPSAQNLNFAIPIKYFLSIPVINLNDSIQAALFKNIFGMYENTLTFSFDATDSILDQFCNLYTDSRAKWEFAGRFYQSRNVDDSAILCFNRAIELGEENQFLYELRGKSYSKLSDTLKALSDYEMSISYCSTCTDAYVSRANFYEYTLKDYQKALEDYYSIAKIKPESYFIYTYTADCKLKLGDKVGALEELSNSLNWSSSDPLVYRKRAEIFSMLEKYNDAIADYTNSLTYNPFQTDLYLSRAILHNKNDDTKSAIKDYLEYIKYNPDEAVGFNNLAYCYLTLNNYDLCLQNFNQSISIDPRHIDSYIGLAILNYRQGKAKGTVQNMSKAIELNDHLLNGMYGIKELEHSGWFWNDEEKASIKKIFKLMNITDTKIEIVKNPRPKSKKINREPAQRSN